MTDTLTIRMPDDFHVAAIFFVDDVWTQQSACAGAHRCLQEISSFHIRR